MSWKSVLWIAWLPACVLLGPGANGDDDNVDEHSSGPRIVGGRALDGSSASTGASGASGRGGAGGTSGAGGTTSLATSWLCSESGTNCTCTDEKFGNLAERCNLKWNCCIATQGECDCMTSNACAAEAASRPGATIVQTCPPGAEAQMSACAADGENCTATYLSDQKLVGCCDGFVCAPEASGVRTCRKGSPKELALVASCLAPVNAATTVSGPAELTVDTQLMSSRGFLPFDQVTNALLQAGPGGCLSMLSMTLAQSSHSKCSMMITAGPSVDATGALALASSVLLDAADCPDFPSSVQGSYLGQISGTVSFDGLSCENGPLGPASSFGSLGGFWCFAGSFELRLNGMFVTAIGEPLEADGGMLAPLSFDQATAHMSGRLCSSLPASSCPVH